MMKRRAIFVLAALIFVGGVSPAAAQDDAVDGEEVLDTANVKTKWYIMDEKVVDGEVLKPGGMVVGARKSAQFDSYLVLSRSFLPRIQATARQLK